MFHYISPINEMKYVTLVHECPSTFVFKVVTSQLVLFSKTINKHSTNLDKSKSTSFKSITLKTLMKGNLFKVLVATLKKSCVTCKCKYFLN